MGNPVTNLRRTAEEFKVKDAKDKRRAIVDGILNNALYILMLIFVIYTATQRDQFLTWGSFANLITQVAAYLPLAVSRRPGRQGAGRRPGAMRSAGFRRRFYSGGLRQRQ